MKWYIVILVLFSFYLAFCLFIYFVQEKIIFFPERLPKDYQFQFEQPFEEVFLEAEDRKKLHALHFRVINPKGVILYLHGNAGSVNSWGWVAEDYTNLGYDLFMLDYRGYGKSEGMIKSENQFLSDVQLAYDYLKKSHSENQITILGYSLGSGPAAYLASKNKPNRLILQAPYYSIVDMKEKTFPIVPTVLLKYRFKTHDYLDNSKVTTILFHGRQDEVIYFGSALKLQSHLKANDLFVPLQGQGHNNMSANPEYLLRLEAFLNGNEQE